MARNEVWPTERSLLERKTAKGNRDEQMEVGIGITKRIKGKRIV